MVNEIEIVKNLDVPSGTNKRMDCPFCYHRNTFSVRNENGRLLWNCFHASCNVKGGQTTEYSMEDIENYLNPKQKEAERFVQACMYPPHGYRSFGPVRGLIYGGSDYAKHANDEMLKLAMIETKESLDNLDEIMSTPGVDGIYIGPADLSLAIGEEPGFDRAENTKAYSEILRILEHAKKNNIFAGIHNGTPEYAQKMISKGFNFVTIGADQRALSAGAKAVVEKMKGSSKKEESKAY